MKKAILLLFSICCALQARALPVLSLEGSQAIYAGGTLPQFKAGDTGLLELTSPTALVFVRPAGNLEIPYAQIHAWSQRQENAIPLGVAPTIVVGLLAKRHKLHFLQITYKDTTGVEQVVIFQVAKTMPQVLEPVLKIRVPHEAPHPPASRTALPATVQVIIPAADSSAPPVVK